MNHAHPDLRPSPHASIGARWFRRRFWRLKHYGERQDRLRMLRRMAVRAHLPVTLLARARTAAREVLHLARSGPMREGARR